MNDLAPGFAPNILDQDIQGILGRPLDRVDGPKKVSGNATYSYEYAGQGQVAYGFVVNATISNGRILSIDTEEASRLPGVLLVMTHLNAPRQGEYVTFYKIPSDQSQDSVARPYLSSNEVQYYGQPVAFVVAESFEQARDAASRVKVSYEQGHKPASRVKAEASQAFAPKTVRGFLVTDSIIGDFETAFAAAPIKVDATYETPFQHHHAIEPHSTMASWDGDAVTLHVAAQLPVECREMIAATLMIPKSKVRILCKFVGGGFGSKLRTESDAVLAALAARQLRRPVKTAFTRQQVFVNAAHRTESIQHVRLAADRDGRMTGLSHEVIEHTATFDEFAEQTADFGRHLYAAPNRVTTHRLVRLDLPMPGDMRAPGEAIGMLAFEQAMDELAYALDMDPIELRIRNEPAVHPETGKPFSTRHLVECYREGAARFGWDRRPSRPGTLRDGRWLVGYGMSAAIRTHFNRGAEARVRLAPDGNLTVETAMTDIGTGTYTVLTQIAAESMGLPTDRITVDIGDTNLPPAPGSGGSFGACSSGSGVYLACMALRNRMARAAGLNEEIAIKDGIVSAGDQKLAIDAFMARYAPAGLEAEGKEKPGKEAKDYSESSYGAHFAEVGVDIDSGEPRLRRMLGVYTAGRILNAKTARSQAIGGLIWGLGSALHEEGLVDDRFAKFVNNDLAGYHFPAHADAVNVDAMFLPELDDKTNPLKAKGVGELGICGSGAAVANAIYNACGVRVRSYPITLDKLILDPAFPSND
ncbi:MAG: xanthine dehydrogenase family protein molybdopterin-binding subunit [Devosia sp.]|uniref:xanthine dehydrogenase family protein molybdopterin-binding subunit n=1 Tax=Devosia sp. TaxID=1871048 RepID=UPI0026337051|nr:xanthine dehydrogenase family protein molybdopterin-binding subunit [Devosia sp.]MDB5541539.1 xanthine dehydrogenase family protein molybdopterin-binding subunit [Devosia sp.]